MSRSWFISLQQVLHLTFIGGKFDRCIHAWICKFYLCTLYKNCIKKLFKLSEPLLFVQCWTYEGRKGKQGIMFCLRPGLTPEWSVFKKLCTLLYACLPSPSARRRREEKSSAFTILTRETSYAYCLCHQRKDFIYMQVCSFFPVIFFIGRNRLDWVLLVYCMF